MIHEMDDQTPDTNTYGKRPLWQWVLLYVIVGLIVYGIIYYLVLGKKNSSYQSTVQQQPTTVAATPTTVAASPSASASPSGTSAMTDQVFTVTGTEFAFTPSTLTVKKGEPVTITFKNQGKYPHNLTITDLNVATKTIQPGQSDTITFTPPKAGSFTFMCTVPGHADRGMKGTLTVQ